MRTNKIIPVDRARNIFGTISNFLRINIDTDVTKWRLSSKCKELFYKCLTKLP